MCTKRQLITQKSESSCLFFAYLSIWGVAMGCVRFAWLFGNLKPYMVSVSGSRKEKNKPNNI